jgi:hypothetical protein
MLAAEFRVAVSPVIASPVLLARPLRALAGRHLVAADAALRAPRAATAIDGKFQQVIHGPSVRSRMTRHAIVWPVGWRVAVICLCSALRAAT